MERVTAACAAAALKVNGRRRGFVGEFIGVGKPCPGACLC